MNLITPPHDGQRHPLPEGKNFEGRPIWEPLILDYSSLIGEDYEQKWKAVLTHFNNDVAKTTKYFDFHGEYELLWTHRDWADSDLGEMESDNIFDAGSFFRGPGGQETPPILIFFPCEGMNLLRHKTWATWHVPYE